MMIQSERFRESSCKHMFVKRTSCFFGLPRWRLVDKVLLSSLVTKIEYFMPDFITNRFFFNLTLFYIDIFSVAFGKCK